MRFKTNLTIAKGVLDITPLIDVVLLLLIFFMLSSSFVFNPGVKVDLPEYSSGETLQESDLVVTITEEGLYFYNDESVFGSFSKRTLREAQAFRSFSKRASEECCFRAETAYKLFEQSARMLALREKGPKVLCWNLLFKKEAKRDLKSKFRRAASENPNARLIIKAAKQVPHGNVVRVMVMAKRAGVKNQAFATRPEQE